MKKIEEIIRKFRVVSKEKSKIEPSFIKIERNIYTLANGSILERETILKKKQDGSYGDGSAAIIVPITKEGEMIMTVESRVNTVEGVAVGLPAGYKEDEGMLATSDRELTEETGYKAESMVVIGGAYQDEGCSRAYNSIILATGCIKVSEQMLDKDEFIEFVLVDIKEAYRMLENDEIKSSNAQLALYKAKPYLKEYLK